MARISRRDLLLAGGLTAASALGGCVFEESNAETGTIYIENAQSEEQDVELYVAQRGESEPLIQARYRVPSEHALQFQDAIEEGQTYDIRASIPGRDEQDRVSAVVDECTEGGTDGERVVSIRARPSGAQIIQWGCKQSYSQSNLEYVDASDYREESIDGTVAGPARERQGETDTQGQEGEGRAGNEGTDTESGEETDES